MKHSLFSAKITNKDENYESFILTREGKALVRGCSKAEFRNEVRTIEIGTCFNKKEIFR